MRTSLQYLLLNQNRLWTPVNLGSALSLWLDADDAATITLNGSTVSQWNDKSGNARNATQATAANQPARTLAGLNGKTVLTFDGNDELVTPSFFIGNTVVAVARRSGIYQPVVEGINVNAEERGLWGINGFTSHLNYGFNGGALTFASAETFALNVPIMVSQTVARGTATIYASVWKIGGGSHGYNQLNGFIAEIVVTSTLLSTTDRERLEGYLAWKWGLQANLPAGHLFRNSPPI